MKGTLCFIISIASFISSSVYAHLSECTFGKETLKEVVCYGPAKLMQTTVSGDTAIAGSVGAQYLIVLASMQVAGVANLRDTEVKANVQVSGNLVSKNGQFGGDLDVTSDQVTLNNSVVNGSVVVKSDKEPKVILICGTLIKGSITFLDKPGIISKTKDSRVEGKVINGKIETIVSKEKCPPSAASLAILPSFCSVRHANDLINFVKKKSLHNMTHVGKEARSFL